MNEVPRVRSTPVKSGERAVGQAPVAASGDGTADRRAFDDALDEGGELHPQQTGATRTAIKRSLNRLEGTVADHESRPGPPTATGGMPRSAANTRDDPVPDPKSSRVSNRGADGPLPSTDSRGVDVPDPRLPRVSGRRADPLPGPVARNDGSDPGIRPSAREAVGSPMGRTADQSGHAAASRRPETLDAGPSKFGEVAVRRDTKERPPTGGAAATVPAGVGGPNRASTDAPGVSRHEGPVPSSARGRGRERIPPERVTSGSATATTRTTRREDELPLGVPERSMPTGTMQHSRSVAGPAGRERLRDDLESDEPSTERAENDAQVDGTDAKVMRGAGLEGLAPPGQRTVAVESGAPEVVQSSAQEIRQVAGQIADRILVSVPAPGASEEVRITLAESVLEGSDIRISREDGEVRIVFVAQTESAQRLLADNRGVFEQTLGERLGEERVHVAVEGPEGRDTTRGEGDGRSRQQYVPQDDGHQEGIEP